MNNKKYNMKEISNALGVAMVLYGRICDRERELTPKDKIAEFEQKRALLEDVLSSFATDTLNILDGSIKLKDMEGKNIFNSVIKRK